MSKELKPCPFCGGEVKVAGPEDWKPTFYDPDSGGEPYFFYCECGMKFDSRSYEYEEAVKSFNTRKPIDKVVEQLEDIFYCSEDCSKRYYQGLGCKACLFGKAIEIVKGGAE